MVLPLIYSVFTCCGFGIRIRIYKGPEYGSNLDPDPQHFFFISGICIRLNTVFRDSRASHPVVEKAGYRYPRIYAFRSYQQKLEPSFILENANLQLFTID